MAFSDEFDQSVPDVPNRLQSEGRNWRGAVRWALELARNPNATASTISLACLEILVHVRNPELFPNDFTYTQIEFPDSCVLQWEPYRQYTVDPRLESELLARDDGNRFIAAVTEESGRPYPYVVKEVPSVVVPQEMNYLINPSHPRYAEVLWGHQELFRFDVRLLDANVR